MMMDLMRRALARPRGDSKRRRATAMLSEGVPGNSAPGVPSPVSHHIRTQSVPSASAYGTSVQQQIVHAPLLSDIPEDGETVEQLSSAQNVFQPVLSPEPPSFLDAEDPPERPQIDKVSESTQASAGSLTATVSERTAARATLMRAVKEANSDSEDFLDPEAKAAMYTAYTDALHKEARSSSGGLRRVVELLREHERNAVVVENAALTIAVLSKNDAATRNVFGQYGALEALLQNLTINEKSPAVVERVALAISSLVHDSPRNVRLLETFDGVVKLAKTAASKRFEGSSSIAFHTLASISSLKHRLDAREARIVHKGEPGIAKTVTYVLRAMRLHEDKVDVQEAGLDAVRTLIVSTDVAGMPPVLLTKCVKVAANAYRLHKESKDVQWQTLALQCDIDDIRDGHYLVELDVDGFFGALRAIVAEGAVIHNDARRLPGNKVMSDAIAGLVSRALGTASRVGWRSLERNDSAADAGAVEVCLETLAAFSEHRDIVEKTCSVMRSLFDSLEGRIRLDSLPTACALLSAIETTCQAPKTDVLLA